MIYRPAFFIDNNDTPNQLPKSLSSRYTFENYLVGDNNRIAVETARQIGQNSGHSYNPLLITGGVGLGKTHLLNAIGQTALKLNPTARVYYTTLERFTRDLIHGIREQRMEDFRHFYRTLDLWLVDDIEFMAGKDQTQEEFLHTFDELVHNQRQVVIASHSFPQDLSNLNGKLRSRLLGGVITNLQLPGIDARLDFISTKMKDNPVKFSQDILYLLATIISGNYLELEGAFNSLTVYAENTKLELTKEVVQKVLVDLKFNTVQPSLS